MSQRLQQLADAGETVVSEATLRRLADAPAPRWLCRPNW